MIYLLDSTACRDLMDGHPKVTARFSAAAAIEMVAVNSIVHGEVLFGIERLPPGQRRDRLASNANALFSLLGHEPVPYVAGTYYARVKRERERLGLPMDENDLWIAATALALGATLVTRDSDFSGTPGLVIEDWTK